MERALGGRGCAGEGPEALEARLWQEFPPSTLHSTTTLRAGARRETGREQCLGMRPAILGAS